MQVEKTPVRSVRKLRFLGAAADTPFPPIQPSPYTPFSGRRSGTTPTGTPQVAENPPSNSQPAPAFAEDYVTSGVIHSLRSASLDIISAIRSSAPDASAAADFVSESFAALSEQISSCTEFLSAPALHAHTRRRVRARLDQLIAEYDTWTLIETTWRSSEVRSSDQATRRLAPDLLTEFSIFDIQGYVKVQRIVEWLERNSAQVLDRAGGPLVKPLDDPAYRWEYTAANFGDKPVSMDFPQQNPMQIDEVERKADTRLSREIFRLVRAGRLGDAESVCRCVGQPWRAAALAGGKNCSALSANGVIGQARKSWRTAAAAVARSHGQGISVHERAVYGLFSGVLEPVLAVSATYEDQAWARLSVLLDCAAERILDEFHPESASIDDSTIMQAFRECGHSTEGPDAVGSTLLQGIRLARAYLCLGPTISRTHLSELLEVLSSLAQKGAHQKQEWVARFAAHVCLYLKLSGLLSDILEHPEDSNNFDTCIEVYAQLVIQIDEEEERQARDEGTILPARALICGIAASYLAELTSQSRIIGTYSKLLSAALKSDLSHERAEAKRVGVAPREIDDRRTLCLEKAGQCFQRDTLDLLVIAAIDLVWSSTIVSDHGSRLLPDLELESQASVLDKISDDDELVIRAIEFLMFPAFQNYVEALRRVTTAARHFFLHGKRTAARRLITWFPAEIISQIPASSCAAGVSELESWRVYMEAVTRHNEWNSFHSAHRPTPLPEKTKAEALAEPGEISYEVQANASIQLEQYSADLEEFRRQSEKHRDNAVERLKAALLFEGGWMQDKYTNTIEADQGGEDEAVVTQRKEELEAVRRIGVPQLAVLLHHVWHESGLYRQAISLAQTIADDSLKLYENFGPSELKSFLTRVADSTVLFIDGSIREGHERPYKQTLFEEIENKE